MQNKYYKGYNFALCSSTIMLNLARLWPWEKHSYSTQFKSIQGESPPPMQGHSGTPTIADRIQTTDQVGYLREIDKYFTHQFAHVGSAWADSTPQPVVNVYDLLLLFRGYFTGGPGGQGTRQWSEGG